jgi:hypothetical protein
VDASSQVFLYSVVESTQRVYGVRLCFVSARTNKRHHHHLPPSLSPSLPLSLPLPKLSTLCYAHAAPRQPEQLLDYTLMYAHIGRLAILHISTRTIYLCMKEEEKNVTISGIRGLKRTFGLTVSLKPRPYTYAQSVITSNGTWPTLLLSLSPLYSLSSLLIFSFLFSSFVSLPLSFPFSLSSLSPPLSLSLFPSSFFLFLHLPSFLSLPSLSFLFSLSLPSFFSSPPPSPPPPPPLSSFFLSPPPSLLFFPLSPLLLSSSSLNFEILLLNPICNW